MFILFYLAFEQLLEVSSLIMNGKTEAIFQGSVEYWNARLRKLPSTISDSDVSSSRIPFECASLMSRSFKRPQCG